MRPCRPLGTKRTKGPRRGKERLSTPGWLKAKAMADEALSTATSAWNQYNNGELGESRKSAEKAVQYLSERYKFHLLFLVVNTLTNELCLQH